MRVPLNKIVVTGKNPRKSFNEDEIERLGQSILEHGQIHPIILRVLPDSNYELITGEMRLRACMKVGLSDIEAETRELSDLEAAELRLIENVHRSDLTDAEKGTAFLELWSLSDCETLKELAEKEQISYDTITSLWIPKSKKLSEKIKETVACNGSDLTERHAQFLMKYPYTIQDKLVDIIIAKKLTSPQLQELTRKYDVDNKANLEELANEVLGQPKTVTIPITQLTEEQKQAIRKEKENKPKPVQPTHKNRVSKPKINGSWKPQKVRKETVKPTIQNMVKDLSNSVKLLCGDILEESKKINSATIDFIITDPMYNKDSLIDYEKLSQVSLRLLKEGGSLIVMTGQSYLPEIYQILSKNLSYNWTLSYLTPGGQSAQLWDRKVNTFWKPILWFTKGKYPGKWIGDVTKSDLNDNDKRLSDYGQSESGFYDLMKRFVDPGQIILDPFMGAGTTGVVALKLNCSFIGIDKNENMIIIASQRLGVKKND